MTSVTPTSPAPMMSSTGAAGAMTDVTPEEDGSEDAAEPPPGDESPPDDMTPAVTDDALEQACVRAAECAGDPVEVCLAEIGTLTSLLELLCPGAAASYIDCLGSMTGCDPEVGCAEEGMALESCAESPTPNVSDDTVARACEVWLACEMSANPDTCASDFEMAAPIIEAQCPGAFGPYIECVAQMTGCEPETECPQQIAALEACGFDFNPPTAQ